jgi:hypothetical protein
VVDGQASIEPVGSNDVAERTRSLKGRGGYFTRNGFEKWVIQATGVVEVAAA